MELFRKFVPGSSFADHCLGLKHHLYDNTLHDILFHVTLSLQEGNFFLTNQTHKNLKFRRQSLDTTGVRYGDNSIELAHEIMKYSDLLFAQVPTAQQLFNFLLSKLKLRIHIMFGVRIRICPMFSFIRICSI